MKYIKTYEGFRINKISELKIHYFDVEETEDLDGKYVLLIKGNLYIIDDLDSYITDIMEREHLTVYNVDTLNDLTQKTLPFIFIGEINDGILRNYTYDDYFILMDFKNSDIDKVAKALGLEYDNIYLDKDDIEKGVWYHGTSYKRAIEIFKKGLMPRSISGVDSNYEDIRHDDKIFLSQNLLVATHHSKKLCFSENHTVEDIPVVIQCKIPDSTKVIPDYDLMRIFYGDDYSNIYDNTMTASNNDNRSEEYKIYSGKDNLGKKFGIIGYQGRIPLSFISDKILVPEQITLDKFISYFVEEEVFGVAHQDMDLVYIEPGEYVEGLETMSFESLIDEVDEIRGQFEEYMDEDDEN